MSWFSRKPTQEKYVEAAITVASNLYIVTIPDAADAPAPLKFSYSDSRYRYMLFCLSTVITSALVYDEKKHIKPDSLVGGCLYFARVTADQNPQEYFGERSVPPDADERANSFFMEYCKEWSKWPALEKQGFHSESNELIARLIQQTETSEPCSAEDLRRLSPLALNINCRLPTMRLAFNELAKR